MQADAPAFLSRFRCIGSECEDNCCHSWRVPVDRATFAGYQAIGDAELKQAARLKVLPEPPYRANDDQFASITLQEDGLCPFQTRDKLCSIQTKLGAEALSDTCLNYPRVSLLIGGVLQQSAKLSCPEAARLALLDPAAMEPARQQTSGARLQTVVAQSGPPDDPRSHARLLREQSLALLRLPGTSVEVRMMTLGLAMRKLTEMQRFGASSASATFDQYTAAMPAIQEQLVGLAPRHSIQVELLRELLVERFAEEGPNGPSRYADLVQDMSIALGLGRDCLAGDEAVAAYSGALNDFYAPYIEQRPWVMPNLLSSYIYGSFFPIESASLFDDYVMLVVRYALIKLHLVGLAAHHGTLTDELLVQAVYLFQRAVDHDPRYLAHAFELLKKQDINSMAFMAILIVS